jgi:uncharacterized OB-fold protein
MTDEPGLIAARYASGEITYPKHSRGPEGTEPIDEIDLSDRTATVITWTEAMATPPGVRQPNRLAIVEFEVDQHSVRVIGQVSGTEIEIGATVQAVYCPELRDPSAGIRESASQSWDGYRFEVVDD